MTSNSNYMRSVNDYSLSAHELFTKSSARSVANHTAIFKYEKIVNSADATTIRDSFISGIKNNLNNVTIESFSIAYDYSTRTDPKEDEDDKDYSIIEQKFDVCNSAGTYGRAGDTVVLESYMRGDEFVIIILSTVDIEWAKTLFETSKKTYFVEDTETKNLFHTIGKNNYGFELQNMKLDTVYDPDQIDTNYNEEFAPIWELILESIDTDQNGLILMHGEPGTGKTSVLKQIIARGGKRKVIYIPPYLAASLSDPSFVSFVRANMNNSVLVIEDAEDVLMSRENGGNPAVANILNISSGIMGDALNILIIATFNTSLENIDKALKRKGRCIAEHEFTKLTHKKAKALIQKLHGDGYSVPDETTLANIYNVNVDQPRTAEVKKQTIGFRP